MRRIKTDESERGVVAPLTAILLVFLLGMTALAVDVGMMYSEHAQLQNGADSSALAIAQACAASPPAAACSTPLSSASVYANGNAVDEHSNVVTATVNAGTVDVTTESRDDAGNNHLSLVFARVLGIDTTVIHASAQAKFGGFMAGNVFPLSFSKCESDPGFTKALQFFPEHGNAIADMPGYECVTPSSSGLEVPGGFGWLDHPAGSCTASVNIADPWVGTNTGHNYDSDCATLLNKWGAILSQPGGTVDILIPIFDDVRGTGANAEFHIEAFAQISLRGWNFGGGTKLPKDYMTPDATVLHDQLVADKDIKLKNSDNGIYGEFIKKVSLAELGTLGGPTTYGALGAKLSN
ncbi:Tad domain-containing protein [Pseudarthrobacter sp. RMG13]|uniref:Tad domain-containing protein n=1 Tax=Pseudarthrobacter humi TaxID=2952523 RepID=A0ABT1LKL5_9MICC|nr:Tad domain-containing protein [Pseudarthrobacter humi]MCP8998424.1 Tad domain-containing protein [Pseudarthrobacter humi]